MIEYYYHVELDDGQIIGCKTMGTTRYDSLIECMSAVYRKHTTEYIHIKKIELIELKMLGE